MSERQQQQYLGLAWVMRAVAVAVLVIGVLLPKLRGDAIGNFNVSIAATVFVVTLAASVDATNRAYKEPSKWTISAILFSLLAWLPSAFIS